MNKHIKDIKTESTYDKIINIAIEKGDFDNIEKYISLKKDHENKEAIKSFNEAMAAFKSEVPTILKTSKAHHGIQHADLGMMTEAIIPAMSKHGLYHSWPTDVQVVNGVRLITVTCKISHKDGHSETTSLPAPADDKGTIKNHIQQMASTMTYLQRYTLVAALGLAVKGLDDDGKSAVAGTISNQQADTIKKASEKNQIDEKKLLDHYNIDKIEHLPSIKFAEVLGGINAKVKKWVK